MEENEYFKEMFELAGLIHYCSEHKQKKTLAKGEGAILYLLCKNPQGISPGELSEKLHVGSGRIGSALKNMEEKGLLTRENDSLDRRRINVTLTEKGLLLVTDLRDQMCSMIHNVIEKMGSDNFGQFLTLTRQFTECFLEAERKEKTESHD